MLTRPWTGAVDLVHVPQWTEPKGYKALLIWTARRDWTTQMHQERQRRRETPATAAVELASDGRDALMCAIFDGDCTKTKRRAQETHQGC
jgi:hypothetical protein